ncbi:unnamed protein product [Urochloa humidicola]
MATKTSPLHKVTDDTVWDAECTFGRLCILAHAAFLPHGAPDTTARSLSHSYSLPRRQGKDDFTVVLRLSRRGRRRGDRGCVVLYTHYVTTTGDKVHTAAQYAGSFSTVPPSGPSSPVDLTRHPVSLGASGIMVFTNQHIF